MEKYPYDTHNTGNLAVQRYLGFSAIFFRIRTKLHFHIILSLAKNPSTLNSLTFSNRRAMTPTHYEETTKTILDHLFPLQEDLRSRPREPSASPATSHSETFEQTTAAPCQRPSLLGVALPSLERLARRSDRGQTRYRGTLA
jgi:hypothetical protein